MTYMDKLTDEERKFVEFIKSMLGDPLLVLYTDSVKTQAGRLRLNHGDVQWMRDGTQVYSFGIPADEFLKRLEQWPAAQPSGKGEA